MSWETLVVGDFSFVDNVDSTLKQEAIIDIENAIESKVLTAKERWGRDGKDYWIEDVNWTSHVSEDEIREVMGKYKDILDTFTVSLYYLLEPDERVELEQE